MYNNSYLSVGTIIHGKRDYTIKQVLGQGSFGITYEATAQILDGNIRQTMRYTLKEFYVNSVCERKHTGIVAALPGQESKFRSLRARFGDEAKRMKDVCHHSNIVSVNEVFEDYGTSFYVMEYLEGQSLYQYVCEKGSLDEDEAISLIKTVGEALTFLHKNMINHLDVKPENIMLVTDGIDKKKPVLIDFGLARLFKKSGAPIKAQAIIGTSDGYSPNEQYVGIDKFSSESDVYALAATLLFCLSGKVPCRSSEMNENYRNEVLPSTVSAEVKNALNSAMKSNSDDRCKSIVEFSSLLPNGQVPQSSGETRTRLIDVPDDNNSKVFGFIKKIFMKATPLLVIVVLIFVIINFCIPQCSGNSEEKQEEKDTVTVLKNSNSIAEQPENAVETPKENSSTVTPSIDETKKEEKSSVSQPTPETESGYKLSYGTYNGSMRNGIPHGRGDITMTVSKEFISVDGRDTIQAKPNDVLTGSFSGGRLTQVSIRKNGKITVVKLGN